MRDRESILIAFSLFPDDKTAWQQLTALESTALRISITFFPGKAPRRLPLA
ncbi:hypothetical protein P4123_31480 [Pseudomonas aeruginosa]|nr:hypothetical protein [Pseudomonas aeruginosa]